MANETRSALTRRRAHVAAMAVACLASGLQASPPAVINARALLPWMQKAVVGRADVVGFGDSNQAHAGDGWDHGWTKALSDTYGLYSTAVLSAGENAGWGAGLGYSFQTLTPFPSAVFQVGAAPSELDRYMASAGLMEPLNYLYLPPGASASNVSNQGILIEKWSPLNVNAALSFRVVYGEFTPELGPGHFQLAARLAAAPYTELVAAPETATDAPSSGPRAATLALRADTRNEALNFRFSPSDGTIAGPFIAFLQRVENTDRASGAAFHTLYAKGLQSARDMADAMQHATDEYLTMFFGEVRALQAAPVRVLIRVNAGVNDRNETDPSLGPGHFSQGNSPEAFADNVEAIMARIRAVWALNGWDQSELALLVTVTHPIWEPDDPSLMAYRAAADAMTQRLPSVAAVHFDRITNEAELLQRGWYLLGGYDRNHLRMAAYEALAKRELDAARANACAADTNSSGAIDTDDLVILLGSFGAQVPAWTGGDADGSGAVDTADLLLVLGTFGAPCAP